MLLKSIDSRAQFAIENCLSHGRAYQSCMASIGSLRAAQQAMRDESVLADTTGFGAEEAVASVHLLEELLQDHLSRAERLFEPYQDVCFELLEDAMGVGFRGRRIIVSSQLLLATGVVSDIAPVVRRPFAYQRADVWLPRSTPDHFYLCISEHLAEPRVPCASSQGHPGLQPSQCRMHQFRTHAGIGQDWRWDIDLSWTTPLP